MMDAIERFTARTKENNHLEFFFNRETGLIVVDLIHDNGEGGNELFRKTLDEVQMLAHCVRKKQDRP